MLVNDLLDISSLESGKFNLEMTQLDINEIITVCAIKLENKIKSKNMDVNIVFDNRREYCIGDRERLIQVVINSSFIEFQKSIVFVERIMLVKSNRH